MKAVHDKRSPGVYVSCSEKKGKKKAKKKDVVSIPDDLFKNGVSAFLIAETVKIRAIIKQKYLENLNKTAKTLMG